MQVCVGATKGASVMLRARQKVYWPAGGTEEEPESKFPHLLLASVAHLAAVAFWQETLGSIPSVTLVLFF